MIDLPWELGAFGVAIAALLGWIARKVQKAKADERKRLHDEIARDTQERLERGRSAARSGRNDSPEQRVRDNDGRW